MATTILMNNIEALMALVYAPFSFHVIPFLNCTKAKSIYIKTNMNIIKRRFPDIRDARNIFIISKVFGCYVQQ